MYISCLFLTYILHSFESALGIYAFLGILQNVFAYIHTAKQSYTIALSLRNTVRSVCVCRCKFKDHWTSISLTNNADVALFLPYDSYVRTHICTNSFRNGHTEQFSPMHTSTHHSYCWAISQYSFAKNCWGNFVVCVCSIYAAKITKITKRFCLSYPSLSQQNHLQSVFHRVKLFSAYRNWQKVIWLRQNGKWRRNWND